MKIMIVSFFKSNNIGDLILSSVLEDLVVRNTNIEVIKYDFLTQSKVIKLKKENNSSEKMINKGTIRTNVKKVIKHFSFKVLGERNAIVLAYNIRRLLSKNLKSLANDMEGVDKVIVGGGNMLMDLSPIWPHLLKDISKLAIRNNIPYDIVFVGVGPISHHKSKLMYREILANANKISVRGNKSKIELEGIVRGVDIVETIDPAFSLDIDMHSERIERITSRNNRDVKIVIGMNVISGVCFSNQTDFTTYLLFIESVIKKYSPLYELVLFSTESLDYVVIDRLNIDIELERGSNIHIAQLKDEKEVMALYEKLDFLIGGRMHALILAQKCLLPYMGIVWQVKLEEFGEITASEEFIYKIEDLEWIDIDKLVSNSINNLDRINKMNQKNYELRRILIEDL